MDDCPICLMPLPVDMEHSTYQACCGKHLCNACTFGAVKTVAFYDDFPCPFCREPDPRSDEEILLRLKKRMDSGDACAYYQLGSLYADGSVVAERDMDKAMELWSRAGELGSADANYTLGKLYYYGKHVQKDNKKGIHHLQLAAMGGERQARVHLANHEYESGNNLRAFKHYIISARDGHDLSLENVKIGYTNGDVTKGDFEQTLRAHKASNDERKSMERERSITSSEQKMFVPIVPHGRML